MVYTTQPDTVAANNHELDKIAREASDAHAASLGVGNGESSTVSPEERRNIAEELRQIEADLRDKAAQIEGKQVDEANALIAEAEVAYEAVRVRGEKLGVNVPAVSFPRVSSGNAAGAAQFVMTAQQNVGDAGAKVETEEARQAVMGVLDLAIYTTGALAYASDSSVPPIAAATGFGLSPSVAAVASLVGGGQAQSSHVEPSLQKTMGDALHLATSGAAAAMSSPDELRQLLKGNGDLGGEAKGRFAEQLKGMLSNETQQLLQSNPELAALVVGHGRGASASPVIGSTSTGVLMAQFTDGLNGRGAQQQQTAGVNLA